MNKPAVPLPIKNNTLSVLERTEGLNGIFEREPLPSCAESAGSHEAEYPSALWERARRAEQILPEITRHLLTLNMDHPLVNLPNSQFKVCFLLINGARTMSQLSEDLQVSVSAITQIADRLESLGLVERLAVSRCGEGDRRTRSLALTPHGLDLMNQWRKQWMERFAATLAVLEASEQKTVISALETLLVACRHAR